VRPVARQRAGAILIPGTTAAVVLRRPVPRSRANSPNAHFVDRRSPTDRAPIARGSGGVADNREADRHPPGVLRSSGRRRRRPAETAPRSRTGPSQRARIRFLLMPSALEFSRSLHPATGVPVSSTTASHDSTWSTCLWSRFRRRRRPNEPAVLLLPACPSQCFLHAALHLSPSGHEQLHHPAHSHR
jgi:hypothetical protein